MSHLENNEILSDAQHGFRKRRGCDTQLVLVINDFGKALNNAQQLDTILLDFSKAFDKVNHRKLCLKLDHYGIRGKLLDWFKDFLVDRTQQVVINGESSPKAKVTSGVPQGTVLGPLLFLTYINDLPEKVGSLRLFADDSYLYRIIANTQDTLSLQKDLDTLIEWEREWSMEFHPDKCKMLRITNKLNPIMADYHIHNHKLDTVDTAKYLGVILHKKLSWRHHVDAICKKANQTRSFLQRNLKSCHRDVKSQCYKTYVRPKLEYASVAWDPVGEGNLYLRNQIEMVQRRAARFVCSDWRWDSSPSVMMDRLKWQSLEERRKQSRLIFLHKYCHNEIDIPEKIAVRGRGKNTNFQAMNPRLRSYTNSFVPTTVRDWNSLPPEIRNEAVTSKFKTKLITHATK
jgi:ribonuclease P/MRP protein subunit RPP40